MMHVFKIVHVFNISISVAWRTRSNCCVLSRHVPTAMFSEHLLQIMAIFSITLFKIMDIFSTRISMVLPRGAAADKFQLRCCVAEGEEIDDATVKTDAFWAQPAVKAKVARYMST